MWWMGALKFFTGGGANGIANQLRQAHKDTLDAENDEDRIAAQERSDTLLTRMEAQTRGEASWLPKLVRACWAAPFIVYTGKIIIYDKVLGLGVTDGLGQYEQTLGLMIAGFFFLDATVHKIRG